MKIKFLETKEELPPACLTHDNSRHNCQNCIYWYLGKKESQGLKQDQIRKNKAQYLKEAKNKYGYLLALEKDKIIGLLQFGPKRVYKRFEDFKKKSTETNDWVIVCLQSKSNNQDIKVKLLKFLINFIKENHSQVKKLVAYVLKNRKINTMSSNGSAEAFLEVGFKVSKELKENFLEVALEFN